ncbi:histidine phosphatase family protein [Telmatospirillum siberiense]|uniref:Histidine phosphatase family protein n=1 Tax=Telmatospirillum siberiense TaxID=382514 RepID=A0A2N3PW63_9PROT|nr:histidine phosphatase family protein [Telmatospirillum siberiense]PKU24646.1 histidine phosphatase family protein [Telmatospirillum siberiense]
MTAPPADPGAIIPPVPGFLFVRHGESTDNARKIRSGGDADPMLTETGTRQAREVARRLEQGLRRRIDGLALIASPLRRTRETARIIAVELGLDPERTEVWEDFRERRLGEWNGLPVDEASQRLIRSGAPPPGGEAVEVFRARVMKAAREASLLAREDRHPLVVSSRGVGWILGWPDMPNATVFTWPPPP